MPTLYLLGTGAALSDAHRTTTMLAFRDRDSTLLVDCGGDVIQRLLASAVDLDTFRALILTHEHIDHVGGFPLFMEKLWLAHRRQPVPVYGLAPALHQARRLFATFNTASWEGLPDIHWRAVSMEDGGLIFSDDIWEVRAAPGIHSVPVMGLRVKSMRTGRVVAYSSDTQPSPAIERLAEHADVLVHEATGSGSGHSSAVEAAAIAADAHARRLLLVHLPRGLSEADLKDARRIFPETEMGEELGQYPF